MLAVQRRCRGLLAARPELIAPSLYLHSDGPGFCLHGAMASYSSRTARLLAAIERSAAASPNACRSDGALDLMTLLFDLSHRAPELGGLVRDRILAQASAQVRLACWPI